MKPLMGDKKTSEDEYSIINCNRKHNETSLEWNTYTHKSENMEHDNISYKRYKDSKVSNCEQNKHTNTIEYSKQQAGKNQKSEVKPSYDNKAKETACTNVFQKGSEVPFTLVEDLFSDANNELLQNQDLSISIKEPCHYVTDNNNCLNKSDDAYMNNQITEEYNKICTRPYLDEDDRSVKKLRLAEFTDIATKADDNLLVKTHNDTLPRENKRNGSFLNKSDEALNLEAPTSSIYGRENKNSLEIIKNKLDERLTQQKFTAVVDSSDKDYDTVVQLLNEKIHQEFDHKKVIYNYQKLCSLNDLQIKGYQYRELPQNEIKHYVKKAKETVDKLILHYENRESDYKSKIDSLFQENVKLTTEIENMKSVIGSLSQKNAKRE